MLKDYIINFHENLSGLKEFIYLIDPFLEEYHEKVSEKYGDTFKPFEIAKKKHFAESEEDKKRFDDELKEIFDGQIEIIVAEDNDQNLNKKGLRFRITGDTSVLSEAFKDLAKTRYHKEQLYKNSLISLLSNVEWFFSQILHFYYDKYPEAAGIKNKTLTLEDLKAFASIKDAEEYLIENKIEEILRASIKDWFKILKDDLKLGLGYKDNIEDELIEIYQRRNLLVHNGGIVNSIYHAKVSDVYREKHSIGDKIIIDRDYLENAISKLDLTFTLISCELWKKLDESDDERGMILMKQGYNYLKEGKWDISKVANYFLCGDKKMPIAIRTAAQLNVWLCKKEEGNYMEIKKEVEDTDYSDKTLIYQIALAALKGDKDFFFKNLLQTLKAEELQPNELFEFPIFREMRETDEFEKFKDENDIIKDYLSSSGEL